MDKKKVFLESVKNVEGLYSSHSPCVLTLKRFYKRLIYSGLTQYEANIVLSKTSVSVNSEFVNDTELFHSVDRMAKCIACFKQELYDLSEHNSLFIELIKNSPERINIIYHD